MNITVNQINYDMTKEENFILNSCKNDKTIMTF